MKKEQQYLQFLTDVTLLIQGEHDEISVLANISASLKETFNFFWVGFYIVRQVKDAATQLYLGPFQGLPACYRISYGRGVCGSSWQQRQSLVVPDVENFPDHIACSSLSKSEIVIPIFRKNGEVFGVLDIDSTELNTFDSIDKTYLEQLCSFITLNLDL